MSKVVIALGGNALGSTVSEQKVLIKNTAKSIVEIIKQGHDVIVTHGNGPQIGMIKKAFDLSSKENNLEQMPFSECGAMSQGYIGYHLQSSINHELQQEGIKKFCSTIVTRVLVDKNDEAFLSPTKPIGSFLTKEEALKEEEKTGFVYKDDAGRGYRRVVASPKPIDILELPTIDTLIKNNHVVITCGGGGIPVIKEENEFKGIDAVIDKDLSSSKLASIIDADILLILTNIDSVVLNYNTKEQKRLPKLTIKEAEELIKKGQFAKGSMLPKVQACLNFVKNGKKAYITSLDKAVNAFSGITGTEFVGEENE